MKLELVPSNDQILRERCEVFDFANPPFDPIEFSQALVRKMYESNGIGLAASQVGILSRIFAMRGIPENFVCFNPRIVWKSEKEIVLEEGCLSYGKLIIPINRPEYIKARFQTPNGETMTQKFIGMTARCFQHEFMHMEGKVFWEGVVSRLQFERSRKKCRVNVTYSGQVLCIPDSLQR